MNIYIADNYLNTFHDIEPVYFNHSLLTFDYVIEMISRVTRKLDKSNDQCFSDLAKSYRRQNCIEFCKHEQVGLNYNCSYGGFYHITNENECSTTSVHDFTYFKQVSTLLSEFQPECELQCPKKQCVNTAYESKVVELKHGVNQSSSFSISIHFPVMSYTLYEEQFKMTLPELIASIGGSLGLFMGIRFLTLVEVLEFFIELVYIFVFNDSFYC